MIFRSFQDKQLSALGFGTMRLPTQADGQIDEGRLAEMVDLCMRSGVNYFDTAYPYHGGMSEIAVGKALSGYPRDSYYLATKYPGHQISDSYDPAAIFEEQLRKCGVDYFDFYLLHNVYENSLSVYLDPQWGILDYFKEQKRLGRIRHLGFSTHASTECLREFLDVAGEAMEFCQIQLNWLDHTLQDAVGKVKLLNERNIPIFVMEPLRGGKLCRLSDADEATLRVLRPDETIPAWSFRYLQGIRGVTVTLSGMSSLAQMRENIETYQTDRPLSDVEREALLAIGDGMMNAIPCTACGYCMASCPMGLNIPALIATYNDICVDAKTNPTMWLEALPADKQPAACLACGKCGHMCPQHIAIPVVLDDLAERLETIPKWSDICRERAEAARRLRES